MSKYKTAKQLGILPEEHKALIAFVKSPALGRTVSVNGHAHYYDQGHSSDPDQAKINECGTAGCVAGFVFAHARHVQKKRKLRGATDTDNYINAAWRDHYNDEEMTWEYEIPILGELYSEGADKKLAEARRVVDKMLKTGRVEWEQPET